MRPVFSSIPYFIKTKSTFFLLTIQICLEGFETPKKFDNLNKQIISLLLAILSNDAPKEWFSDCVNDKCFGFVVSM